MKWDNPREQIIEEAIHIGIGSWEFVDRKITTAAARSSVSGRAAAPLPVNVSTGSRARDLLQELG
jgi:hypothetical protein